MFCRNCGKKLGDQAKFCGGCGTQVLAEVIAEQAQDKIQPTERTTFNFWQLFLKSTAITTAALSLVFGLMGSFEEEAGWAFLGTLILAALFGFIYTIIIRERNQVSEPLSEEDKKKYTGISGWLTVVALGLIVTFGYSIYSFVEVFFTTEDYAGITWLFMYDFIGMGIAAFYSTYVLYLFFNKKKIFPKNFIYFYSYLVLFNTVTIIILNTYSVPDDQMQEYYQNASRTAVGLLIWGTYVIKSKRSRATFVNS